MNVYLSQPVSKNVSSNPGIVAYTFYSSEDQCGNAIGYFHVPPEAASLFQEVDNGMFWCAIL